MLRAVAFGSRLLPTRPVKDFHLQSSAHAGHTNPMKQGATTNPGEALRTLLRRAPNILVIPGTTTIAHLEANTSVLAS